MKQYEAIMIGPVLREIRKGKGLTVEDVADTIGVSVSTLSQIEQGGRNLSMRNLYGIMEAFRVDANTVLNIKPVRNKYSIDERLDNLDEKQREYFFKTFSFMLDQAEMVSA